jgi:hypothetical protein
LLLFRYEPGTLRADKEKKSSSYDIFEMDYKLLLDRRGSEDIRRKLKSAQQMLRK